MPADLERLRQANRDDRAALELIDRLGGGAVAKSAGARNPEPLDVDAWVARIEGPADPSAGERVFFHTKGPGCYRCHQVDGRGGKAGPDLTTLASATDRRRLVESIVAPSREIAPQFVSWNVARTDGTVFTGILLEQSPDGTLIFADSEGRRIGVRHDEIAERKPQKTSIMPEDVVPDDDRAGAARSHRFPRPTHARLGGETIALIRERVSRYSGPRTSFVLTTDN